jgi:transcriptional regulator with XRE-family HTH domain
MKQKRQLSGLSQAKLAEKIGTATNYISKIESEKQFPSIPMLEKIANALNIDTMGLFSTNLAEKNRIQVTEQGILDNIQHIDMEELALVEQNLHESTKKVQELSKVLKKPKSS